MLTIGRGPVQPGLLTKAATELVAVPTVLFLGGWLVMTAATALLLIGAAYYRVLSSLTRKLTFYIAPLALILLIAFFVLPRHSATSGIVDLARLVVLIGFGLLFSLTTSASEIPGALLRLGIPHRFGIAMMIAFRLVSVLSGRVLGIVVAQKVRGASWEANARAVRYLPGLMLALVVPSVHAALEDAIGLHDALVLRGYVPNRPITMAPRSPLNGADATFVAAIVGLGLVALRTPW